MSWHFSRALVEEYLGATLSDGELSAPLNMNPMPHAFCLPDRMTVVSRLSRFGMTFAPLTESHGEELLMSYLAGFLVRTSVRPGKALASPESDQDSGQKWHGLLAKFNPATSLWKTAQCSLFEDSEPSLETWPRSGSMRSGECWERPMFEHRTSENACGFWPTPTVCGNYNRKGVSKTSGDGLATAVARTWPTATATAYKGWSPNHNRADTDDRLDYTVEREAFQNGQKTPPKRLNPVWVEWLMGWPQGWTDLKPLAMGKFQEWQQQHSVCSETNMCEAA